MALILSAREGESVYIGDVRLVVIDILSADRFKVLVEGPLDTVHEIRHTERVEVLPEVFLSAGNTGSSEAVKLVFEAPKDRVILRERLYRRSAGHESV